MRRTRAFTLIELVVTLAVVAVLLGTVVPALGRFLGEARLTGAVNQYVTAMHATRTLAAQSGRTAVLCPTTDEQTCDAAAGYDAGWLLTTNPADASAAMRVWEGPLGSVSANYPGDGYVRFGADGMPRQASGAFLAGTASFCLGAEGRKVILSRSGRLRTTEASDC